MVGAAEIASGKIDFRAVAFVRFILAFRKTVPQHFNTGFGAQIGAADANHYKDVALLPDL